MDTGSRQLRFTSVPGRPSLESPLERDLCKLGLRPRFISSPDNPPARLLCSTAMTDSSKSYNDAGAELEKKSIEDSSSEHGVGAMDALKSGASGAATAKLWTKLDLLVLPVVTMMYFLSSLVSSDNYTSSTGPAMGCIQVSSYSSSLRRCPLSSGSIEYWECTNRRPPAGAPYVRLSGIASCFIGISGIRTPSLTTSTVQPCADCHSHVSNVL